MYPIIVMVKIIQLAMVEIMAEGTAEEENVVKVEMIKTLSLLTIQLIILLGTTPLWSCHRVIDVYLP